MIDHESHRNRRKKDHDKRKAENRSSPAPYFFP